jgi:predicted MFS family arabinose efflux permease
VRRILVPAFLLYGSAMAALYMAESTAAVVAAGLLGGAAHGLAFPAVQSLGYGRAPAGYGGSAIALITGMMDAGAMATAVGLGVVAQAAGYPVPFLVAAFGGLLASLLTLISVLRDPHRLRLRPAR